MPKKISDPILTEIIDNLAPFNNKLRAIKDPISKIETMWDFGKILNAYITRHKIKLHELLYQIYDPHSTIKVSNITRDLGSYCYRVYQYFNKKEEIKLTLGKLQSYVLFREAIPLLFNKKYGRIKKNEVFGLLNSNSPNQIIKEKLVKLKQNIRPIKNPRNQKAYQYQDENMLIKSLIAKLKKIYDTYESIPQDDTIDKIIGDKIYRGQLINLLLAISSDSFIERISMLSEKNVSNNLIGLLRIASGKNIDKSRFRKWVLSSNKLLSLAEAIHSLNSKDDYIFYRNKVLSLSKQSKKP